MLHFSGTNYLGIDRNKAFQSLVFEGFERYGLHYGGSRFSKLCPEIYEAAEDLLCQLSGAEAALIVSSGTVAGWMATKILNADRKVYSQKNTHPALLQTGIATTLSKEAFQKFDFRASTLLCNSVDPLYCQESNFDFIHNLDSSNELVIDYSHGLGITGKNGSGIFNTLKKQTAAGLTVTASLGKVYGIPGGIILSSWETIKKIKALTIFGGSAPAPPAYLFAFVKGQSIYHSSRLKLRNNIRYFQEGIASTAWFKHLNNYPVFYTKRNDLANKLLNHRILISAFHYPTEQDELICRIIINSNHSTEEIGQLLNLLIEKQE